MKRGKLVVLATMLVLLLGIGSAQAGTFANGAAPAGSTLAAEIFGTGSSAITIPAAATMDAVYTMAATPGNGSHIMVTYTLTNAVFSTTLTAASLTYTASATGVCSIVLISGGTAGSNTVTFRADVTADMAATDTFTLAYDVEAITGTVALAVELTESGDLVDSVGAIAALTVTNGSTETVDATNAVAATRIDVATDRTLFTGGASTTDVVIGRLVLTDNGATQEGDGADGGVALDAWTFATLGAGGYAVGTGTDIDLTITGNFGASLNATVACATGGIYIAPVAGADLCPTTLTATTATFTIPAARLAAGNFTGTNVIRMEVDGVTAIDEGAATVAGTVNFTNTNAMYLDDSFSGTLFNLTNNGTTRYLYNIPAGDNANAVAYVKIINDSVVDGRIRGTLILNDGTAYTGTLQANLAAGNTVVMSSADIATALGTGSWSGRARLIVNGEIPSMQVQGTVTQAVNGLNINTNFSTVAP